jgi:predicted DNA-binding transcriptional regulator YafY
MTRRIDRRAAFGRALYLGLLIGAGEAITTDRIRRECHVSKATAKRDMIHLERALGDLVEITSRRGRARTLRRREVSA